jgi:hypothetical protein
MSVLWILIRRFWPNSKKSLDSDPDDAIKFCYKNNPEKSDVKHLKENKMYSKPFFLFYRFRNTYERNESHSLEKCHVKILVFESESVSKNDKRFVDPNPIRRKLNSDPQRCCILCA